MKTSLESDGRISQHSKGLGTVTDGVVEKRAEEISRINGRSGRVQESDREQARLELLGVSAEEGPEEVTPGQTQWDERPETKGHQVTPVTPLDEQTVAEQLVHEGVEEAGHDQMLEGSKPTQ